MDVRISHHSNRASDLIPTYYDRAAVKPSLYGFTVALYIYVGGLAAGPQIVVSAIQLLGIPQAGALIFVGRCIALVGAVIGGVLLIWDLHTKRRFYNMLRIFRATSPMSIGTYVLLSFGFWSLLAWIMQIFALDIPAAAFGVLASVAGWWMMTYTAALLAETATPLWAAAPRLLGSCFAASAMATGAASLCLAALMLPTDSWYTREFGNVAAASLFAELLAAAAAFLVCSKQGLAGPLRELPLGPVYLGGVIFIGVLVPLGLFIAADLIEPHAVLRFAASSCLLVGGLLMRSVILEAGNKSARRPRDYFRWAGARRRVVVT